MCGFERVGRHLFDVSNTVFCAILNCEWPGEEGGRHLFDVSSTVLVEILNCEWFGY